MKRGTTTLTDLRGRLPPNAWVRRLATSYEERIADLERRVFLWEIGAAVLVGGAIGFGLFELVG